MANLEKRKFIVTGNITVQITPAPLAKVVTSRVVVDILPAETPEQRQTIVYPFRLSTNPITVNITDPLIASAYEFVSKSLAVYIDEERELKTLLNYGDDKQSVVLSYRPGTRNKSIQLKLLQPVPSEVTGSSVFLTREVAKTLIDKVRIRYAPLLDKTPYLRPKNTDVKTNILLGNTLKNVTMQRLSLQMGSVGALDEYSNLSFEDQIFRKWYSFDFDSSELNIDFTNYENFVFYSSAAMRLYAFREKLKKIETIEAKQRQFITSSFTGSEASAGAIYLQELTAQFSVEKETIIRGFDRYEQYLYFTPSESVSPYSASFAYADTGTEYNSIGYWPKSGSVVYPVTSSQATTWFETQLAIAQRYDDFNENNLVNTLPSYLRDDDNSAAYITFVTMIGHMFDTIKPYIDQFPNIYSRFVSPNEELSKDLVNEISEAFGFRMPTVNSIYNLAENVLGTQEEEPRRDYTAETYKRLLHNLPFFAKAKGSKFALTTLLRTLGISSEFLNVQETGTPTSSSYKLYDEFSTGLDFDSGSVSYIKVPMSASLREIKALQFNVTLPFARSASVLTGDDKWVLNVEPHPDSLMVEYGRFKLMSGSQDIIISQYHPIFTNEIINVTLQNTLNTASLQIISTDADSIVFNSKTLATSSVSASVLSMDTVWDSTQYLYIGGSGSLVSHRFDGLIDEFRVWGTNLSNAVVQTNAFDPGSNAGDVYSDAADYLYTQLSFNYVDNALLQASSSLINESPYKNKTVSPSLETIDVYGVNTASFARYSRSIRQPAPQLGGIAAVSDKIKVLPPPVFNARSLDKNGIKKLDRLRSIVQPDEKRTRAGKNVINISISPTQLDNENIIRNLGLDNINNVLGLPSNFYTAEGTTLKTIKEHYKTYYYTPVEYNKFIRILSATTSVLDQILDYFIPTRASVLKGMVIESGILDKQRIRPINKISVYGSQTRKTKNAPSSLTGSRPDYHATFNVSKTIDVPEQIIDFRGSDNTHRTVIDTEHTYLLSAKPNKYNVSLAAPTGSLVRTDVDRLHGNIQTTDLDAITGKQNTFKGLVDTEELNIVFGKSNTLKGLIVEDVSDKATATVNHLSSIITQNPNARDTFVADYVVKSAVFNIDLAQTNKVSYNSANRGSPGAEPYNRLYARKLFDEEIGAARANGTSSIFIPALREIPPTADLRDYGVRTYFNDPDGVYLFPKVSKSPTYPKPINFVGAATWSYGSRYNIYDVVYQEVTTADAPLVGETLVPKAKGGNGRYYVFARRPAYVAPVDGTAWYSGSIPTYIPPSLDRTNWQLLKFKPIQVLEPKKVVFDLFTVKASRLNNYKVTICPVNTVINTPDRYIDEFVISSLLPGDYASGQIVVQNMTLLFALQSNASNLRIRFYRSLEARDADTFRGINVYPDISAGVLLDTILGSANQLQVTNPIPTLTAGGVPLNATIYYTINNLDPSVKLNTKLFLYYYALEIEPRIPRGYLRKHYRFFRDTSTATRRRNYEGCKNTEETTIDGLPPVQVFFSEGNTLTVSNTITNQELNTGGGGQLDVR